MKRSIITILILVLVLTALAGCGRVEEQTPADTTPPVNTVRPEDDNGMVEDGNGIIGDNDNGNKPAEGVIPEIGNDIEQGADDIIDGVGDAITGNDNNAGSDNMNNTNDAGSNTRGRIKTR